jgi:uncharacterized protein
MIVAMTEQQPTFVVTYRYVPDMEQRRTPVRPDHLAWLRELAAAGQMILAGATLDPVDTAVLIVRGADLHAVRTLLLDDPYARANLIVDVAVRPIGLAVGG